jgi:hypothetical protein
LAAGPSAVPTSAAAPAPQAAPIPKIDPLADQLLTRTCATMGTYRAFSFHAEVMFDQVLPSAVKIQFAGAIDLALQRPDELAIDYHSDLGNKELWYQKDTLTLFDPQHLMYGTLTVPDTIDAMLDEVAKMHHLWFPLSNFAYGDPCARIQKQIIFGSYIGVNDVNGVATDHIAFSSHTIDLQLWLERTPKPVPLKIVISYRSQPGSPEYIAFISQWKFPKHIANSRFQPQIPKDAKQIRFLKFKQEAKP